MALYLMTICIFFADNVREPEHMHNIRYLILLKIHTQGNVVMLFLLLFCFYRCSYFEDLAWIRRSLTAFLSCPSTSRAGGDSLAEAFDGSGFWGLGFIGFRDGLGFRFEGLGV